jgi:hypothetical protein
MHARAAWPPRQAAADGLAQRCARSRRRSHRRAEGAFPRPRGSARGARTMGRTQHNLTRSNPPQLQAVRGDGQRSNPQRRDQTCPGSPRLSGSVVLSWSRSTSSARSGLESTADQICAGDSSTHELSWRRTRRTGAERWDPGWRRLRCTNRLCVRASSLQPTTSASTFSAGPGACVLTSSGRPFLLSSWLRAPPSCYTCYAGEAGRRLSILKEGDVGA